MGKTQENQTPYGLDIHTFQKSKGNGRIHGRLLSRKYQESVS